MKINSYFVPLGLVVIVAAAVAVAPTVLAAVNTRSTSDVKHSVARLGIYQHVNSHKDVTVPANISRVAARMAARKGGSVTGVELAIGSGNATPALYTFDTSSGYTCTLLVAAHGVAGSCTTSLNDASGTISYSVAGFDGQQYVFGLADGDVSSVNVSTLGTSNGSSATPAGSTAATVLSDTFLTILPSSVPFGAGLNIAVSGANGLSANVISPAVNSL